MSFEFSSHKEFESWLDESDWFQDGYCLGLTVDDETSKVVLTLAYQVKGTYEANSERVRRVFEIAAEGVLDISKVESNEFNPEHCMEGIDLLDSPSNIQFTLDTPKKLDITCKKVIVTEKENLTDIVKPWFSDNEIFVQVNDSDSVPSANNWINWFKEDGVGVSWRYYAGEVKDSASIPSGNYEGWYLQETSVVSSTKEGLFFQYLKTEGDYLGFHARRNEFHDRYWQLFMKYLLNIKEPYISCGNCKFSHQAWKAYLSNVQKHG